MRGLKLFKDFEKNIVGLSVSDYSSDINYCYTYFSDVMVNNDYKDTKM